MKRSNLFAGLVIPAILLVAACGGDPVDHAAAARHAFVGEDYAAARINALAALEVNARNRDMLVLLAQSQLAMGDGDGAQSTLTRLQENGTRDANVLRMLAEAALLRGQSGQVTALLEKDNSPDAWRLRADAHLADNDAATAVAAFRKGMAGGDNFLLARDYTRFLLDVQDFAGAAGSLEVMRSKGPDRFDTLMLTGDLASRQGRQDEGAKAFAKAAERYPARFEPLLALATVADMKGNLDQAIALTTRASAIAPKDGRVASMVVQLASEKGDWAKVRDLLAPREADLDPRSADGLAYAEALLRLGHAEQARALFNKSLSLSPQNPYARLMLGEAQLATGDGAAATRTLRPLADSVLAGPRELELAAKAAHAINDPVAAGYEARLRSPQLQATRQLAGTAQAAMNKGDLAAAINAYSRIPGYDGDAEVLKRMAFASSNAGRADDALRFADRALSLEPRNPDMLHMAGMVRLNSGRDRDAARRLLQQAIELDPANRVFRGDLAKAQATKG